MGVFDKNIACEYCKKEMAASYRSKRFCSDKCRVYFGRKTKPNAKPENNTKIKKNVTDTPVQKELSKADMFKLMREGKM